MKVHITTDSGKEVTVSVDDAKRIAVTVAGDALQVDVKRPRWFGSHRPKIQPEKPMPLRQPPPPPRPR